MKRTGIWILTILVISLFGLILSKMKNKSEVDKVLPVFSISSPEFKNGGKIPSRYTCDGDNISPPLSISGIPKEAKTLALVMEDPDVPKSVRTDGLWVHWVMFNLPAQSESLQSIPAGESPTNVGGINTSGKLGYGSPCPPDREHRYFFRLYALDIELNLVEGATKGEVEEAMRGHILAVAELMGRYERVK